MNDLSIKQLLNVVQNKNYDDLQRSQKFFKNLEESFESEFERCKYFLGCMVHPEFLSSFENPSIFITSTQTYEYVIKTCGYTFEDVPTVLLLGYYFGYIHYQIVFHQRQYPKIVVETQRALLANTFPCISENLVSHNTTRYSKTWCIRFLERDDFQQVIRKLLEDLSNKKEYLLKFKKSKYLSKVIHQSILQVSTFVVVFYLISKEKWMKAIEKCITLLDYQFEEIHCILSLYYFGSYDALHGISYEQFNRIRTRIDTSNIQEIHDEYSKNPQELLTKLTKNQKRNRKKKQKKEEQMLLSEVTELDETNVQAEAEAEEKTKEVPKEINYTYYYDESIELIDLYNTLSYLHL